MTDSSQHRPNRPYVDPVIERLCAASRAQYTNPYTAFEWQEALDPELWCMKPELVSLAGTSIYERLSEAQKRKLSFYEIVNFFSLTLHGEQMFISKLVPFLYRKPYAHLTEYMQHFLDEEVKHIVCFGDFCVRYAGKVYPDLHVAAGSAEYARGESELAFFTSVLIFEEMGNYYNVELARDPRLNPIVREINAYHRREEARHRVFGRQVVQSLFAKYRAGWTADELDKIREYLAAFIMATWKEYFNPAVYDDAGLEDSYSLYEQALESAEARARFERVTADISSFLVENEILLAPPTYAL